MGAGDRTELRVVRALAATTRAHLVGARMERPVTRYPRVTPCAVGHTLLPFPRPRARGLRCSVSEAGRWGMSTTSLTER